MFCPNYTTVQQTETLPFPPQQSSTSIPTGNRSRSPLRLRDRFSPSLRSGQRVCWSCGRRKVWAEGPALPRVPAAPWESITHPAASFQPFYANYFLYSFMQILPTEVDAWKCICHTPDASSVWSRSIWGSQYHPAGPLLGRR